MPNRKIPKARTRDKHLPPIVAYHAIFGAYGFWLPNDPRGSWSTYVWADRLQYFGEATTVSTSRSLARAPHDPGQRRAAKVALKHSAVRFNGRQALIIGNAMAEAIRQEGLVIHAAAIMPDHVHLVISRHQRHTETWVSFLKRAASRKLRTARLHPFINLAETGGRLPSPWCEGGWKVYLHRGEVRRAIDYVEQNPLRAGLPAQHWSFVTPYYE